MTILTSAQLSRRVGPDIFVEIFDDDDDDVADADVVDDVLRAADAQVYSFLPQDYVPSPASAGILFEAAMCFALQFSYERRPEVARRRGTWRDGEDRSFYDRGKRIMRDLRENSRTNQDLTEPPEFSTPDAAGDEDDTRGW